MKPEKKQTSLKERLDTYRFTFYESLRMRKDFSNIDGYVRKKTPEEQAYHGAKKAFGEFSVGDNKAMENNTNSGKGATVKLPNGKKVHLDNQLILFNKVVEMNSQAGGFYDEQFIEKTSSSDHKRLLHNKSALITQKREAVSPFLDKKEGWNIVRGIEQEVRDDFKEDQNRQYNAEAKRRAEYRDKNYFQSGKSNILRRDPSTSMLPGFANEEAKEFFTIPKSDAPSVSNLVSIRKELETTPHSLPDRKISLSKQYLSTFNNLSGDSITNKSQLAKEGIKGADSIRKSMGESNADIAKKIEAILKGLTSALKNILQCLKKNNPNEAQISGPQI